MERDRLNAGPDDKPFRELTLIQKHKQVEKVIEDSILPILNADGAKCRSSRYERSGRTLPRSISGIRVPAPAAQPVGPALMRQSAILLKRMPTVQ